MKDLGIELDKLDLRGLGKAKKVTSITTTTRRSSAAPASAEDVRAARRADPPRDRGRPTSDYDREKLQERLAKLTGGIAQINVGGATETEVKERRP